MPPKACASPMVTSSLPARMFGRLRLAHKSASNFDAGGGDAQIEVEVGDPFSVMGS